MKGSSEANRPDHPTYLYVPYSGKEKALGRFSWEVFPLTDGGKLDEALVKVDSKGRICISHEFREQLRDVVKLKKTRRGISLSPGETGVFIEEFRKLLLSEPRRTGIPENPPAKEMKEIWKKAD